MTQYDELKNLAKESKPEWCAKPGSEKCYHSDYNDRQLCGSCFYYAPNFSKHKKTPMDCSTCLYDLKNQECMKGHLRMREVETLASIPVIKCLDWKIDLSKKEMEEAEKFMGSLDTIPMIRDELKEKYPHGHPKFLDLILDEIRLHSDKNHDFAKGGNPLGNFNRVGAILDLYPGLSPGDPVVVAISFMLKQLDASLWMLSQGYAAKVEGHAERWRDIAVYAKIISILIEEGETS